MIELFIKGEVTDARAALAARGFNEADWLTQPVQLELKTSHRVVRVGVKRECEPGTFRWFEETDPHKLPFPPGTLLHYQYRETVAEGPRKGLSGRMMD